MAEEKKPSSSNNKKNYDKLAEALRKNLKRRKASKKNSSET